VLMRLNFSFQLSPSFKQLVAFEVVLPDCSGVLARFPLILEMHVLA